MLLKGYTTGGSKIHAVASLARDPNPLKHSHGQSRAALCGTVVRPQQHVWKTTTPNACARCVAATAPGPGDLLPDLYPYAN